MESSNSQVLWWLSHAKSYSNVFPFVFLKNTSTFLQLFFCSNRFVNAHDFSLYLYFALSIFNSKGQQLFHWRRFVLFVSVFLSLLIGSESIRQLTLFCKAYFILFSSMPAPYNLIKCLNVRASTRTSET